MSFYLFADGQLLGIVSADQREDLELDHLRGIEFIEVAADVEACVTDLRKSAMGGGISCPSLLR